MALSHLMLLLGAKEYETYWFHAYTLASHKETFASHRIIIRTEAKSLFACYFEISQKATQSSSYAAKNICAVRNHVRYSVRR